MKKIIILVLIFLTIMVSLLIGYLYMASIPEKETINNYDEIALKEEILKNSSWIYITKDDLNGYLTGTYTSTVEKIINSLEEAIPVIFQITNKKFSNAEKGTFVVASAFDASGKIHIYYHNPDTNKYKKTTASLEYLLEDTNAVYIYSNNELEEL